MHCHDEHSFHRQPFQHRQQLVHPFMPPFSPSRRPIPPPLTLYPRVLESPDQVIEQLEQQQAGSHQHALTAPASTTASLAALSPLSSITDWTEELHHHHRPDLSACTAIKRFEVGLPVSLLFC